ncbi:MAG: GDP-mannose 4,6-dehydratase [Anaerolineaceae bacterium]
MSILKDKHILLTGAGGFIGSRLAQRLVESGAHVRAFVRYNSRADTGLLRYLPPEILSQIDIVFGNITDPDAVDKAFFYEPPAKSSLPLVGGDLGGERMRYEPAKHFEEQNVPKKTATSYELVFHLGALISIPYSYLHPVEVIDSNIIGTLNVLQACRKHGIPLVHTSTSEVYGTAQYVPIDENHPLQGQSPYSASKIGADKLVEAWYRSFDVQSVTVRPFNTYGPGQSGRAVIPTIITQALTQESIHLGSLDTRRDFTFVDDTVHGFILAAEALLNPDTCADVVGQTFNLGTGSEVSIGEIALTILDLLGKKGLPITTDPERIRPEKSEVMRLLSDNRKAGMHLGWRPGVGLEDGLALTIEWIKAHLDLYRLGTYER